MSNKSVGGNFIGIAEGSTAYYFPISSSRYRSATESFVTKKDTSMDSHFPIQQLSDMKQASFQTSNFKDIKSVLSFGPVILDYIAQAEAEARDKIISQYTNEIRSLIRQDEFFDGEVSRSERYMIEAYKYGQINYITEAIMSLYSSSLGDTHMLEGILTMISCVPYEAIAPQGQIMAMGLLTNKALAVRDKAIQCFERWNSKKGLDYLKNIDCSPNWLQKYVEKVIMYIERDGAE